MCSVLQGGIVTFEGTRTPSVPGSEGSEAYWDLEREVQGFLGMEGMMGMGSSQGR